MHLINMLHTCIVGVYMEENQGTPETVDRSEYIVADKVVQ
jgi:hypothetical protein